MPTATTPVYRCINGHEVSNAYGRPVGHICPVYVLGLPCGQPLTKVR